MLSFGQIVYFYRCRIMLTQILVPILYFILFLFIINNKRFFKSDSISKNILLLSFSLKALSALIFGYLFKSGILTGNDTLMYFNDSNIIYSSLKENPYNYLQLVFGRNNFYPIPAKLLPYIDDMGFWFDNSNYFLVRINAFIRLFSFGIYNAHAVVFSFLSFIGIYNIYLFFENKVINKKILQLILFGIPSVVFWTSGVHKEAIVFFTLGISLYNLDAILELKYNNKNVLFSIIGLVSLGYIRIYLLLFLVPLLIAIYIFNKSEKKHPSITIFLVTIIIFLFIAFLIDLTTPQFSLTNELIVRRRYFVNSSGNFSFPLAGRPHDLQGILLVLWDAITNPFIRPLPTDSGVALTYLASLEAIIIIFILIKLIYTVKLKALFHNPYALFSILFGFSTLFLVGLIVNNSGAIVRYRSIAIPFILIGFYLKNKENNNSTLKSC